MPIIKYVKIRVFFPKRTKEWSREHLNCHCGHGVPSAAWSGSAISGSAGSCCWPAWSSHSQPTFINVTPAGHPCIPAEIHRPSVTQSPHQLCGTLCHLRFSRHLRWLCFVNDWRRIYFRNHSLMSYSDVYVSVDLAITFVILDTLKIYLWLIDWTWKHLIYSNETWY